MTISSTALLASGVVPGLSIGAPLGSFAWRAVRELVQPVG